MSQINDNAAEAIEQLSNQYETDEDTLEERYREYLEEEQEKGVSDPEKRAIRRLALSEKGGQMQSAEQMGGVVYGASDPINTSASAIRNAKEFINNKGVQKAVKHGLVKHVPSGDLPDALASLTVTKDGEEQTYAVLDSNSNSPTSGEVLPAEDYIRYVYGAVFRTPDSDPEWFSGILNADENGQVPPAPPMYESVQFKAVWVGESDQNNTVRLRFQDTDPFRPTDDGPDALELLEDDDLLGHVSLDDADSANFERNDIVATYGSVTYMELAPDEGQSRRLSVVDPFAFGSDLRRTVWLEDHIEVNFAEESDVYIIGQVSESNNEYPDSIAAHGVLPHPDYVVDRSDIESMGSDESGGQSEPQKTDGGTALVEETDETDETDASASEETEDDTAAVASDEQAESASESAEESAIPEDDQGDFEPTDEDDDWSW